MPCDAVSKILSFFSEDVFTEINKHTNPEDKAFFQKAGREKNKLILSGNEEGFKAYET